MRSTISGFQLSALVARRTAKACANQRQATRLPLRENVRLPIASRQPPMNFGNNSRMKYARVVRTTAEDCSKNFRIHMIDTNKATLLQFCSTSSGFSLFSCFAQIFTSLKKPGTNQSTSKEGGLFSMAQFLSLIAAPLFQAILRLGLKLTNLTRAWDSNIVVKDPCALSAIVLKGDLGLGVCKSCLSFAFHIIQCLYCISSHALSLAFIRLNERFNKELPS